MGCTTEPEFRSSKPRSCNRCCHPSPPEPGAWEHGHGDAIPHVSTWWKREGSRRHGHAPKLLVLADSGGSNGCSSWAWKTEIQAQLCNPFGITATVAHYPTGASKWNPIEHRLFSEISKHWAAEPLVSYEKMLGFIRNTSTKTGLVVTAYLDRKQYPTGLKPDRQLISSLDLKPGKVLPRWNYTIAPNL